jgi:hypothetical protein
MDEPSTTTTALNELLSRGNLEKLPICTSKKKKKKVRYGTRAIKNLVSKRTKLSESFDTQVTQPLLEQFRLTGSGTDFPFKPFDARRAIYFQLDVMDGCARSAIRLIFTNERSHSNPRQ